MTVCRPCGLRPRLHPTLSINRHILLATCTALALPQSSAAHKSIARERRRISQTSHCVRLSVKSSDKQTGLPSLGSAQTWPRLEPSFLNPHSFRGVSQNRVHSSHCPSGQRSLWTYSRPSILFSDPNIYPQHSKSLAMSSLSQPQTPASPGRPLREHRHRPVEILTDCLETPSLDDRSYRVVKLPSNQLEVLLVHDADTDKASAAMDVNVGNFSDKEDMPGMA